MNEAIRGSVEALELVLDHIDVALLVLKSLLLNGLVTCLHYLHLTDVLLTCPLQSTLQEVPEDEIH